MNINAVNSALGMVQGGKTKNEVSNNSENNFLSSLANLSIASQGKNDVPVVYAGQGKAFEFWTKDEKVTGKPDKMFSIEDELEEALEKIGIIIKKLKEQRD